MYACHKLMEMHFSFLLYC